MPATKIAGLIALSLLPTLASAACTADNPRDTACLDAVFNTAAPRVVMAYQKLLRDAPNAHGSVSVSLVIGADGTVQSVETQADPVFDDDFLDRLKRAVAALSFGPAASAGRFTHQFNF